MRSLYGQYLQLRALLLPRRVEREMDEELRHHVALETERHIQSGISPEEARRRALVAFGGVDTSREAMRDGRGVRWLDDAFADVRYALRWLARAPGFTAIAVLTLAIGIGATTAIFAVVQAVLLNPLPYADADRLAILYAQNPKREETNVNISYPDYLSWKEELTSFEQLAIFQWITRTLTGEGEAERISAAGVSADVFPVLGVAPILGRVITAEEEQRGEKVLVLGEGLWQRRFGGDRSVIGRTVAVNGEQFTIVGVMPASFRFPYTGKAWVPLEQEEGFKGRRNRYIAGAVGRLAPGVTQEAAIAELARVSARLAQAYPESNASWEGQFVSMREDIFGTLRTAVLLLFVAAGLVLLIVCGNLANLLIARGAARQREIALRAALGARRGRLLRQQLTESVVLAFIGGAAGIGIAAWGITVLRRMAVDRIPEFITIALEPRVFAFTFALAAFVALLTGVLPALRGTRTQAGAVLKEGGRSTVTRGSARVRNGLIVAEVALTVILLAGSALLMKTMGALNNVELGFDPDNVLTGRYSLPATKYDTPERRKLFLTALQERLSAQPGVIAVGSAQGTPFSGWNIGTALQVEGEAAAKPGEQVSTHFQVITPTYFETMRIPVVSGRNIEDADAERGWTIAVVNEAFVARHFAGQDPVGKRFRFNTEGEWVNIVGVVGDFRHFEVTEAMTPAVYLHYGVSAPQQMTLAIRTQGPPSDLIPVLRRELAALDPDVPAFRVEAMQEIIARRTWVPRIARDILAAFALTAALLAVIGLYGVISYSVTQQRHEYGIRLALGAGPRLLLKHVVSQGLLLALLGVAIGWLIAFSSARALADLLFEVEPGDLATFLLVPLAVLALSAAAASIPALRAAATDPMRALRGE